MAKCLWWDTRHLESPTDRLKLDDGTGRILGGSSLEYNIEAGPAKYLVGTEQGVVLSINMRKKKSNDCVQALDMGSGKHHGPIYSIQRNPTHTKFFLTVSSGCALCGCGCAASAASFHWCLVPLAGGRLDCACVER